MTEETDDTREVAQSARAAFRSWSITGGTRDASFKKRPKASQGGEGEAVAKPRSVGFAAVLSMSGWSEVDAEEVDLTVQMPSRGARAAAPLAAGAGKDEAESKLGALAIVEDEEESHSSSTTLPDNSWDLGVSMKKKRLH